MAIFLYIFILQKIRKKRKEVLEVDSVVLYVFFFLSYINLHKI